MAVVTASITPGLSISQTLSSGIFSLAGGAQSIPFVAVKAALANGTAADGVDLHHVGVYTMVASTTQTIDLTSGLTDPYGNALVFARVRLLVAAITATTDGASLSLIASASNGATNVVPLTPGLKVHASTASNPYGGFAIRSAPNTTGMVVDSSHKSIDLTPSAHAFTLYLYLGGASA